MASAAQLQSSPTDRSPTAASPPCRDNTQLRRELRALQEASGRSESQRRAALEKLKSISSAEARLEAAVTAQSEAKHDLSAQVARLTEEVASLR